VISHNAKVVFSETGSRIIQSPYFYPGTAIEVDVRPATEMAPSDSEFF
jgi:hypothetical protein